MRARVGLFMVAALAACGGDDSEGSGTEVGTEASSEGTSASSGTSAGTAETADATSNGSASDSSSSGDPTTDPSGTGSDTADTATGSEEEIEVFELRVDNFSPPVTETFYSCSTFQITRDSLTHIVGFVPQVTNPAVHHYVLSIVEGHVNLNPANDCQLWPNNILWAWAPGIEELMLPPEAGILLGDSPGGEHTFVLQVHYNNPLLQEVTDNDGLDVLLTEDLRPNPAAVFSQGDIGGISIPGGQAAHEHIATCDSGETSVLFSEPINVFASFLHAHEIGSAIWSDVYRDGSMVGNIASEDPFDFNQQKFLPADIEVRPGDEIRTHCIYDSSDRQQTTDGGEASDEEMCINFMMYYPRVPGQKCGTI